jgi:hypothetical protein
MALPRRPGQIGPGQTAFRTWKAPTGTERFWGEVTLKSGRVVPIGSMAGPPSNSVHTRGGAMREVFHNGRWIAVPRSYAAQPVTPNDDRVRLASCEDVHEQVLALAVDRLRFALAGDCRIERATLVPLDWEGEPEVWSCDSFVGPTLPRRVRAAVPRPEHPARVKVIPDKGRAAVYDWGALVHLLAVGRLD